VVRHAAPPELAPAPTAARALAEPAPAPTVRPAARAVDPAPSAVRAVHRGPAIAAAADLRDEIAVVDAARTAVSAGDARGALQIVRRYEARHASGAFHPEATAIKIEALMNLGRETEARSLALKFVAEQRGTLLANRVADLVGLAAPATNH